MKKTYSNYFPEIADFNSGAFWDRELAKNQVNSPMSHYRNQLVAKSIPIGSKVLNLGVGNGELEKALDKKQLACLDWTGTDITKTTLKKLTDNFSNFHFRKTKLEKLPFASNSFDIVCLLEVLEHIRPSQTFEVLAELVRVLKPNGTAIISVPVNEHLEEMMPQNPNAHLRDYSEELVEFELKSVGLKVKKCVHLTAFRRFFRPLNFFNRFLRVRETNNLIFWLKKIDST